MTILQIPSRTRGDSTFLGDARHCHPQNERIISDATFYSAHILHRPGAPSKRQAFGAEDPGDVLPPNE